MKVLAIFFLCGLSLAISAQTALKTFTSADGTFQFQYPSLLVHCRQQNRPPREPGAWSPGDSCQAFSPVCDESSAQDTHTQVCFAYPSERFKQYPTFNAAAFAVAEVRGAPTEKKCLAGNPGWVIDPRGTGKVLTIGNTKFHVFATFDISTGNYLDGHIDRTFHRGVCYQLSIRVATTNAAVFDPPVKEMPQQDNEKILRRLTQARDSFRFLK